MGGDHAPEMPVAGAILASNEDGIMCILVGDEAQIAPHLEKGSLRSPGMITVVHAPDKVGMHESPTQIIRKKESSNWLAINEVREGRACAAFSAGNTGAFALGGRSQLGFIEGIDHSGLTITFPTNTDQEILILDAGASPDCEAKDLLIFAHMGKVFAEEIMGRKNPRIGLLNIGEEKWKGNETVRAAYALLTNSNLNFVGNVEGNSIPYLPCDVVVCDGFMGNTLLKVAEGTVGFVGTVLKSEFKSDFRSKLGAYLLLPALSRVKRRMDWKEWGGGVFLGLKGNILIGHGRSDAKAIRNGVRMAARLGEAGLWKKIEKEMSAVEA
jgi:glycerol-3-phosphate acyltransferase PlsX